MATSGTQSVGPLTMTTSYSLVCSGAGGTSNTAQVLVTVSTASGTPTAALTANPTSVASGGSSILTWSSANATACMASGGWSGALAASGALSIGPLTSTTLYSLFCSGAAGSSAPAQATVTVAAASTPTASLTANPTTVAGGGSSILTWTSTNATACTASGGWSGLEAASGSVSVAPPTTTTYSLVCTGAGGSSTTAQATVTVSAGPPTPTASLGANPIAVTSGSTSVLSWSSTNATSCTASGGWSGALATSGTNTVGPLSVTTVYDLICSGAGGSSATAQATVSVGAFAVTPKIVELSQSQPLQFMATGTVGGVNWTVDGVAGGNASVGTINSTGLYTAGSAVGAHTIMVSSNTNSALSDTATATVTDLTGVYSYHNDIGRDGANTQEYALTTANVNTSSFGKLFSCAADGAIYAQPLWVANLSVNGAQHNVVFVATQHDSLYAFDADASPCEPLWSVSLIDSAHGGTGGETSVPSGPIGYLVGLGAGDITPETGVAGTPVIDPATNTLYVVSKSVDSTQTNIYQRLHAIDVTSGNEKMGSPTVIAATSPGGGDGGTSDAFDSQQELQRAGLALVNGVIYITWSSHEDNPPFYGWVMGYSYNGTAFTQNSVVNVAPDAGYSGIWMAGSAPAADSSNNLYLITGNGQFDITDSSAPTDDYGDSLLELTSNLNITSYFTPSDQLYDQVHDQDFGAGGVVVVPDLPAGSPIPRLVMGGGKDAAIYILNRDALGGFGDNASVQEVYLGYEIFSTGAFWNNNFYIIGVNAPVTAFALDPTVPQFNPGAVSTDTFGFPGSTPSISATGTSNGILWALDNRASCTGEARSCGPAVLHAHDASNVATELWNSSMVATDAAGNAVKFTVPTVANGKVYIGTRGNNIGGDYGSTTVSGELDAYGLLQPQ